MFSSIVVIALMSSPIGEKAYRIPGGEEVPRYVAVIPVAPPPRAAGDLIYQLPPSVMIPISGTIRIATNAQMTDYGHNLINVKLAWSKLGNRGKGVRVAVLDTGVDSGHPDLKDRVVLAKNFTGSPTELDIQGHGTHCAGVIAATDNTDGVVGVAPECEILAGKVLGDSGSGISTWMANGIDWAVNEKADVISMSIGSPAPDATVRDAIRRATAAGVIVVCAAGNSGPGANTVEYPGGYPESVCVAACDRNKLVAEFSSRGSEVDVIAPGVSVISCYPGSRLVELSGTSMATPYVAGVAALYVGGCKSKNVKPTPVEFRKILEKTSITAAKDRPNTASGWGLIQAETFAPGANPVDPPKTMPGLRLPDDLTPEARKRWELLFPGRVLELK